MDIRRTKAKVVLRKMNHHEKEHKIIEFFQQLTS